MAFQLMQPQRSILGKGALQSAGKYLREMGGKAFIVTGRHVAAAGAVKKLTDCLDSGNISYSLFTEITGEPTVQMIKAGTEAYKNGGCDFIIGMGGGSPLDSAKAIAAMTALDQDIAAYAGKEIDGCFPPMALIPTTAGTGSEATKFTIITDTGKNIKMLLKGEKLLPALAVVDPELGLTAPPSVTAATGMDALTHAAEAYTSRLANPLTDMYALSAVKRIFKWLPIAYRNGSDIEARTEMALAAYEAGICINNASVTVVHGMSRPIGALFHVPHGISNAMLITDCLRFAMEGCYSRFADLARAAGAARKDTDDTEAAHLFVSRLQELCGELDIPDLRKYGIDRSAFEKQTVKMAADAIASGSPANTIRPVSEEDIIQLYRSLWR